MRISVSNLNFLGLQTRLLDRLPKEVGLELFTEFGSDSFWNGWLKCLLLERSGSFSIHGPHQNLDLADPDLVDEAVLAAYRRDFSLGKQYQAAHIVVHPNSPYTRPYSQRQVSKDTARRRIGLLAELSREYGVPLCVENMGYGEPGELLFDKEEYLALFDQFPTIQSLIDIGKIQLAGWDIEELMTRLRDRITAFHLHDNNDRQDQHLRVGAGAFDWERFQYLYHSNTPQSLLILEYIDVPLEQVLADIRLLESWDGIIEG